MATMREIAERAGVSVYTVSAVMNDRAKEARISPVRAEAIKKIAAELEYRPNSAARAMRAMKSMQAGVLIRNNPGDRYTHPLAFETICGINEGLEPAGYIMSLIRIGDVEHGNESRVFREHVLDGLIVIDAMPEAVERRVESLVPKVVWADAGVWRDMNCIRRDELGAATIAANKVIEAGYRKVVWFGIPSETQFVRHYSLFDRKAGVRQACKARPDVSLTEIDLPDVDREAIVEPILRPLLKPDVCFIAYGVYQARWLQSAALALGLRPGWDYGLACCDDAHSLQTQWPQLSRVGFDRFALGLAASQMLLGVLQGKSTESVKTRDAWIAGETVRRTLD